MKKIIAWPFVTLFTLFVLSFTLTNRQDVVLGLFPLPIDITVPLFVPIVVAALFGLMAGLLIGWCQSLSGRRALRQQQKTNQNLVRDLAQQQRAEPKAISGATTAPLLTVPVDQHVS